MGTFVDPSQRAPGVYQDIELQRQAGLAPLENSICLIGYRDSTAPSETDGTIQELDGRTRAQTLYGAGSMMDLMVRNAIAAGRLALNDQVRGSAPKLFAIGLAPPSEVGDVAATWTITVTGTATADGFVRLYLGPDTFVVPTFTDETATEIAARIDEFIDRQAPEMAFTAAAALGVVTLTARHAGEWGNDLVAFADTVDAPGVSIAIAAGTAGVGNLDLSAALATSLAQDFGAVVVPQYDAATQALLAPHVTTAWSYDYARYRVIVAAQNGDVSDAQTAAAGIDSYRVVLAHGERLALSPRESARSLPCEIAAAVAGRAFSQSAPNWNFNLASLPVHGRSRTIDRSTLNDTINAGVCEVVVPETGGSPGAFVDPVTTAVTDQTGQTTASDTTWQPIEYAKTQAFILRQMKIALERFSQLPATEETRISGIATARTVLAQAALQGFIGEVGDEDVTAAYDTVGGRTDLVITLDYRIIVGLDVIAVRHRVRSVGNV